MDRPSPILFVEWTLSSVKEAQAMVKQLETLHKDEAFVIMEAMLDRLHTMIENGGKVIDKFSAAEVAMTTFAQQVTKADNNEMRP